MDEDPHRSRADLQERPGAGYPDVPPSGATFREQAVSGEARARLAVIRAAGLLNRTARQADREVVAGTYGDILETAEQLKVIRDKHTDPEMQAIAKHALEILSNHQFAHYGSYYQAFAETAMRELTTQPSVPPQPEPRLRFGFYREVP